MRSRLVVRLALAFVSLLFAADVSAHTQSVAHVRIVQGTDAAEIVLTVDLALPDLELAIGVDGNGDGEITWRELESRAQGIAEFAADGLKLSAGDMRCTLLPGKLAVRDYGDGTYAHQPFNAKCGDAPLALEYALLLDQDAQHRAMLVIERGGKTSSTVLDSTHRSARLDAPRSAFQSYFREGVRHILIGYDHLAFLASLLLAIALVRREGRWQRDGTLLKSFGRAAVLVTAFTAAHSVTLTLAALGWVTPASRPIEIFIAASVVVAALNNVWPFAVRRLWMLALAFGLIHGFGFAGALGELGLPQQSRLSALIAFNLGVEAGQLCVVAIALPLIHFASRWRHYPRAVMQPLSIVIAGLGAWWLFERLTG